MAFNCCILYLTSSLTAFCLPGLLQGQWTGTMWLVARPGPNDEGRGNVTVALTPASLCERRKHNVTMFPQMPRNTSFLTLVLKLHWRYSLNLGVSANWILTVQSHVCVHLPKHKYKGSRLSNLKFVTLSSSANSNTVYTVLFNCLPIWILASLCVMSTVRFHLTSLLIHI